MILMIKSLLFTADRTKNATQQVLDEFQNKTCIPFQMVNESSDKHFIQINEEMSTGCGGESSVGRQKEVNEINIEPCINKPEWVQYLNSRS